MASHSSYPHLLHPHSQPSPHLPPPPQSSVAQTPDLRLPSLRSLNFEYPPVGEPGAPSVETMSQAPQRVEQAARTSFAPDEYYHQRDMAYYQDPSSSSHAVPAPPPAKRTRSNSGARSPYALQPNGPTVYQHPQAHETHARTPGAGAGYTQGHAQGTPQHYSHPQQHQADPSHSHPPYYGRLPQPSQNWYYHHPTHQPPPQQPQHLQQPHSQHPQQPHQPQRPQQQQQQQQPPPPPTQNVPQKHPLPYSSYPPPPPPPQATTTTNSHSPHSRGSFSSGPQQGHLATAASPTAVPLVGPGTTAATTDYTSSPTAGYTNLTSLGTAPATSRTADAKALGEDAGRAAAGGMHLSKIMEHSRVLCDFANHYASMPHLRPSPNDVTEMAQRASLVLQLVDHLRRLASATGALTRAVATCADGDRAYTTSLVSGDKGWDKDKEDDDKDKLKMGGKKRPWEDGVEGATEEIPGGRTGDDAGIAPPFEMKDLAALRSVAEKDMAIIRSKRGQGNGAGGTVQGIVKVKYRKRSRATPPGKCHSCNIRETPEWRRGPDGARTLCNACGLHYAKLIRKRDKALGTDGHSDVPPIDLEMLRASTRMTSGDMPGLKSSPSNSGIHSNDAGFRGGQSGEMNEIQLQPVPMPVSSQRATTTTATTLAPQMGVAMQVHQWTPPGATPSTAVHRDEGNYELAAYSTSLMRSSNARGSPA